MKNVDMNNITMTELVLNVNTSVQPVIMKMIVTPVLLTVTEHILQAVTVMMDISMMVPIMPFVQNVVIDVPHVLILTNVQLVHKTESMPQLVNVQTENLITDMNVKLVEPNVQHVLVQQILVISVKLPETLTHQAVHAQMDLMKILTKSVKIVIIHVLHVPDQLIVVSHVPILKDYMLQDVLAQLECMIMDQMQSVKNALISVSLVKMSPMTVPNVKILEPCQTVNVLMVTLTMELVQNVKNVHTNV